MNAVIKDTRIPVHIIIGYSKPTSFVNMESASHACASGICFTNQIGLLYLRVGETPESLVEHILPHLTLDQVYDALSYYHDHREEIDQELADNTEASGKAYLREHLGEDGYLRITGQNK